MYFNSFQFLVFLMILFAVFFSLPHKNRIWLLFLASYYFYACWNPWYLGLIVAATWIHYRAALAIHAAEEVWLRRLVLWESVVLSLGMLFFFKYLDFTIRNINAASAALFASVELPLANLILPAGISFFTFQSMSYTIDVYRGHVTPERSFLRFATFVAFFPQLVAGPIERARHLLPQFADEKHIRLGNIRTGLQWILLGVFKKMVIADSFAVVTQTVFNNPYQFNGPIFIVGAFFFGFQVYCDFSGYSDIAVGVARLFGYDLMINFKQPFMARSIADHWQRWHVSLTMWFRDYVYIPLGGNRVSTARWAFNVFWVFFLSGFWHGANWTYLAWGTLHAAYFLVQHVLRKPYHALTGFLRLDRIPMFLPVLEWAVTLGLVMLSFLFFRALSLSDSIYMFTHVFDTTGFSLRQLLDLGLPTKFDLARSMGWVVILLSLDFCLAFQPRWAMWLWSYRAFRWLVYTSGVYAIACFGVFEQVSFIYFQF